MRIYLDINTCTVSLVKDFCLQIPVNKKENSKGNPKC